MADNKASDGNQFHSRPETENWLARRGHSARVSAVEIGSEQERRSQRQFPAYPAMFGHGASTSTIARTATSAVMSEMS